MDLKGLSMFDNIVLIDDKTRIEAICLAYKLFHAIKNIETITLDLQLGFEDSSGPDYTLRYLIDGDVLYSYASKSGSLLENDNSKMGRLIHDSESQWIGELEKEVKERKEVADSQCDLKERSVYEQRAELILRQRTSLTGEHAKLDLFHPLLTDSFAGSVRSQTIADRQLLASDTFVFGKSFCNFITSLNFRVMRELHQDSRSRPSQYLGPLRYVPTRSDLQAANLRKSQEQVFSESKKVVDPSFYLDSPWLRKSPKALRRPAITAFVSSVILATNAAEPPE